MMDPLASFTMYQNFFFSCLLILLAIGLSQADPASDQLPQWAQSHKHQSPVRTALGSPFVSLTASLSPDHINGPILLQDVNFIDIMSAFDHERIPERVVHAKGGAAHGIFNITHDITRYSKAGVFGKVGRTTPIFARFSTVIRGLGGTDTIREPRGFAVKFYTKDGNWDITGFNLPIFAIRDPVLFASFIHSTKPNPRTHLFDYNSFWDFISLRPETIHFTLLYLSDLGLPDGFRHMNGFSIHAFKLVNDAGEVHFAKFHFLTEQGVKNLSEEEAGLLAATDPDYSLRDLYNSIETGDFPKWTLYAQIISAHEAKNLPGAFDPTLAWDEERYPLRPIGEMILNRNPDNYFAEVEQSAFSPVNLVPGIEISPDRLLQGRSFSYADTQRHRLGPNFAQIPINRPRNVRNLDGLHNYLQDGPSCQKKGSSGPNYFPNSFGGPKVSVNPHDSVGPPEFVHGAAERFDNGGLLDANFAQAKKFYEGLSEQEQERLLGVLVKAVSKAIKSIQDRVLSDAIKPVSHDLWLKLKAGLEELGKTGEK